MIVKEAWPHNAVDAFPIMANNDLNSLMGFLELEPGTKAHFIDYQTGIDDDYFINGYSATLLPGGNVIWSPVLKLDPGYWSFWVLGISTLGVKTILG
jgi:hypothetical protein